ncbi:MFS transporter [Rhodopseudomonas palustris]|uniref:Major facilitator superfamily MFS_1 n=1 Tax=Rhodopseudomonas palustris (strain BisB18) TaxID=316056 RepID=Q219C4_RHOPB
MPPTAQIPISSYEVSRRFAGRLALFYGMIFGLTGSYLPFFPVWLKAVGIEPTWIGLIIAVPALTRFTLLPLITGLAERSQSLRGAMIVAALATFAGFAVLGTLQQPVAVLIVFALTACAWTPLVPLTDGYALKGVVRYGLNYGPLRLWGSAAFVVGALGCGLLADVIAAPHLIWVIAAMAALGAVAGFGLQPLDAPRQSETLPFRAGALLRDRGFLAMIGAAALIQGSHAAYYTFGSIAWQSAGLDGATIAGLWALGVIAEIVVFALSPRFTLSPVLMMVVGGLAAALRWSITAQDPPLALLAGVQLMHGLSFGLTQVGTMTLMVRHVPSHVTASAQGYLTAAAGIVMCGASIGSGVIFARFGSGVYLGMAVMATLGAVVIWLARRGLDTDAAGGQPQSSGSGG